MWSLSRTSITATFEAVAGCESEFARSAGLMNLREERVIVGGGDDIVEYAEGLIKADLEQHEVPTAIDLNNNLMDWKAASKPSLSVIYSISSLIDGILRRIR